MLKPTLFMSFLSFDPGELILNSKLAPSGGTNQLWDMIQIFIFSFFAVLARGRTRAHASA